MKEKILQIALILTVACQVRSENEYEIGSGTFVVSSTGKTRSGGVLAKENKTTVIATVTNTGDLVDGMINTNISNSKEIRSVFASMKKLNITFQCNITDYSVFVVKFCQKQEKKQEQEQEQEQNQQEAPPKGTYSSTIQILQTTQFFGGEWTLRLIVFVKYDARLFTKKAYEACPRKQAIESLKNLQGVNKTSTEISYKRSQAETAVEKVQEHGKTTPDRPPKGVAKLMPFVRPIFIKITVKLTRKMKNLKEDESLYYAFFDFENQCVVIKAGRFRSDSEANNKTKVIVTGLNLTIEVSSEKEGEHTFMIYDNRFKYVRVPRRDHMTKKANRLVAVYGCDAFNEVTMDKEANGTLFTFDILEKQRSQERNLNKIVVYVSNEKKKEEHSVTPPALITKEKVSLSGCFHIKTGASKAIHGNKVDIEEKVRKIDSCDLCPAVVENWLLLDGFEENELMSKIAAHQEQGVKPKKPSNLVTCGTVSFEVSSKDKPEPNGSIPKNVFILYMNAKKILNEDGKQIAKEQSEGKQKERYTLSEEENAKHAMKILELLQPAFDKNVQDAVADIKKSISAKFGKDIWDTAEYISELKIARTAACTDSCQGTIKAVLQYKLTRKPKPVVLQPKVNFKMLLRFHFFAKFMKPQTLPTTLMKRLYSPKYRSQKMPMIKQTPSPMHATKNKPPTLTKAVPESPMKKLRFEAAKDKRNPFSMLFLNLDQHREFLGEQKMEKNDQPDYNPLKQTPNFQVSNIKKQQYRDGEVIYDKKQLREALKRVEEDKPGIKSNSGYALSVGKSIIIALVNCIFLFKL